MRPSFARQTQNGLVPVLVDGDFVLWESNAIITYLATMHPDAALAADGRADVDRWLHWQSAHMGPVLSRIAFERFVKPMTGLGAMDGPIVASASSRTLVSHSRKCTVRRSAGMQGDLSFVQSPR
jgi:glutathione S-transferase